MDSRHASLLILLAQDEKTRFVVPHWRRQYVWGTAGSGNREVEQLWQDLRDHCVADKKHFCGPMLLHKLPKADVPTWEIVDGQQRMTTFFLLLFALRDVCEKRDVDCSDLHLLLTTNTSDECRLALLEGVNNDPYVMKMLLQRSGAKLDKKVQDESKIYQAYRYFVTRIESDLPHGMQEFFVSVLQGVDLLVQVVDPADDPRQVFETLNAPDKRIDPKDNLAGQPALKRAEPIAGDVRPVIVGPARPSRRITAGIMGLSLLALLCLGAFLWWRDYTRVKTAYYQEVTSRYSLPEGVGILSGDAIQHRATSYRIESSRRKIRRVTEINGSGYPVDDPARHYASIEEIHYRKDGSLDFNAYLNRNGREVFRETYRDLPDITAGSKRHGVDFKFHGQNASVAPGFYLLSDGDYDGANEVGAKSDIVGATLDYTPDGRTGRIRYRNNNGISRPNGEGVFARNFEYNQMGLVTKISNLGPDGKPSPDKHGVVVSAWTFDALGNPIEGAFFGVDGQPVLNKDGIAKAAFKHDERGHKIEVAYFGIDDHPVSNKEGIVKVTAKYDERGNVIEQSCLGIGGQPMLNKSGYAGETLKYDERGNVTETAYLGIDGQPVANNDGASKLAARYDARGNLIETACFGIDGQPVLNKSGYAGETLKYDEGDNVIETTYFGADGKPILAINGYAKVVFKYNERGNKIEDDYLDIDGRPVLNKNGVAKETFKYDEQGNVIEQLGFGIDGLPALNQDGAFMLTATYDERGNVIETACFGIDGQPVLDKNGLAKESFKYDERDNPIEQWYSGVDGRSVLDRNGVAKAAFKYDEWGNKIEVDYLDADGKPVLGNDGFVRETLKYDRRGNMIEVTYLGIDGRPKLSNSGFAKETLKYDEYDRLIEGNCYDINGQPIEIGGISRIVYTYDTAGKVSAINRFNAKGQLVP